MQLPGCLLGEAVDVGLEVGDLEVAEGGYLSGFPGGGHDVPLAPSPHPVSTGGERRLIQCGTVMPCKDERGGAGAPR